nr:pleckstrin homology domain-containing family A member 8-like [Oncorhynchus nerka]
MLCVSLCHTENSPVGGDPQGPEESAVEEEATTQTTHTNPDPEHTDQPAQQEEEEEEEFKEVEQEMSNAQEEEKPEVTQNQQEAVTDQEEAKLEEEQPAQPQGEEEETEQVDTFFSTMSHRFSDIRLDGDSGIPTQAFLDSCYAIVPVLGRMVTSLLSVSFSIFCETCCT